MATHAPVEVAELFGDLEPAAADRKWLVVRTKPRREKKLAEFAGKAAINYYLPQTDSVRIYQKRKVVFTKPLFSGYVFVKCTFEERRTLTLTGHTAHFLQVSNEAELLEELRQIYNGSRKGAQFRDTKYLDNGTKVLITAGPFEGLTGYVKDQKNITEVVLQINLLRQAVAVSVNSSQVRVIEQRLEEEDEEENE